MTRWGTQTARGEVHHTGLRTLAKATALATILERRFPDRGPYSITRNGQCYAGRKPDLSEQEITHLCHGELRDW